MEIPTNLKHKPLTVCTANDHIDGDIALFQEALAKDGELLGERIRVLKALIAEL